MNTPNGAPKTTRTARCRALAATVALGSLSLGGVAHAAPHDFVVYVTRLGGDPEAAQPYIDKFLANLEASVGWQKGSTKGSFVTSRKEALAYLDGTKPGFGIVEPALYLEVRKARTARPLVQVVSTDLVSKRLHLVVKDAALAGLPEVKGKRLWTQYADTPDYLNKVIFAGKTNAGFFQLKQVGQAMKGARSLLRGEADATLLDDEQLDAAKKLDGGGALRAVYDSSALPPLPLVSFGDGLKPDEVKKLVKVLIGFCDTPKGGEVCKEMHISKFAPVDTVAMGEAQKRYEQP